MNYDRRRKSKGWRGESRRHSLAAKGIKSGRRHHSRRTRVYNMPMVGGYRYSGAQAGGGLDYEGRRFNYEDWDNLDYLKHGGTLDECGIDLARLPRKNGKDLFVVQVGDDIDAHGYVFDDMKTAEEAYNDLTSQHDRLKALKEKDRFPGVHPSDLNPSDKWYKSLVSIVGGKKIYPKEYHANYLKHEARTAFRETPGLYGKGLSEKKFTQKRIKDYYDDIKQISRGSKAIDIYGKDWDSLTPNEKEYVDKAIRSRRK